MKNHGRLQVRKVEMILSITGVVIWFALVMIFINIPGFTESVEGKRLLTESFILFTLAAALHLLVIFSRRNKVRIKRELRQYSCSLCQKAFTTVQALNAHGRAHKRDRPDYNPRALSKTEREYVMLRDGYMCCYCGTKLPKKEIHIDHVYPYAKGGETTAENSVVSCRRCNLSKSDKVGIWPNQNNSA